MKRLVFASQRSRRTRRRGSSSTRLRSRTCRSSARTRFVARLREAVPDVSEVFLAPPRARHSARGAELLAADAPRGSRRDYCWSPRIQRSAVVSAPLPDSLERALHAHADEGSGGRAARAWPPGAAGPQPRARALPAGVAECGKCDTRPGYRGSAARPRRSRQPYPTIRISYRPILPSRIVSSMRRSRS